MKTTAFPICIKHYNLIKDSCCNEANVPLTIKCMQQIINSGYKLEDFVVAGEYCEEDIEGTERWWRDSMLKKGNKFYKQNIQRKPNKDCIFLKEGKGCILGKKRPLICKIYPFWISKNGRIIYEPGEKEYCLLGIRDYSVPEAMRAIGENGKKIKSYFNLIKKDCIKNKKEHAEIIRFLLKNKKIQKVV